MVFCVVVNEAMLRYRSLVWEGCCRIEATANPIVFKLEPLKGSLPESKIVAVFFGRENPRDPDLRP